MLNIDLREIVSLDDVLTHLIGMLESQSNVLHFDAFKLIFHVLRQLS